MSKDWLIAHRGFQKIGKENTMAAFLAVKDSCAGWIEFDVHTTKDNIVICHHDFEVGGLAIDSHDYKELIKIDPDLTIFDEAVNVFSNVNLIIEIKPVKTAKNIIKHLNQHPEWLISSYKIEVINELIELGVDRKRLLLLQHRHSFRHIAKAKKLKIGGIGINQRLMTPRLYRRATDKGFITYTYTVNSTWQAKLFRMLYPKLMICSDNPDLFKDIK